MTAKKTTAIAMGALAIFAVVIVLSVYLPHLAAERVRPHWAVNSEQQHLLVIGVTLKNFGSVSAYSLQSHAEVTINGIAIPQRTVGEPGTTLPPQSTKSFQTSMNIDAQFQAIAAGRAKVKFELVVMYKGLFWEPHRYRIVQIYDPTLRKFVPSEEN